MFHSLLVYYLLGLVSSKLGGLAGRSSLRDEGATLFPLFGESLSDKLLVRSGLFLVSEDTAHLFGLAGTLSLQGQGGDQSLDLGGLANGLSLLVGEGTGDDVLADIVVLGQIEKLADVASALGTQTTGDRLVGQSLYGVFSGLGDDQVQDGKILADDAAADRLALSLSRTTGPVGLVSLLTKETHPGVGQDALAHGEALLVVSSRDAEDVSLELLAQDVSVNFLGHTAFVQVLEALFVIDFDDFLLPSARASDIDLEVAIMALHGKSKFRQRDDRENVRQIVLLEAHTGCNRE